MTIAQELKITEFPFEIKNSNGKTIYHETSDGYWFKREYDANGNWTSSEDSDGYWSKWEYDDKGSLVYWETELGIQVDKRPKTVELTLDEIAQKLGIDVNLLKIKK